MSLDSLDEYWVPEHVKDYLRRLGFVLPLDDMPPAAGTAWLMRASPPLVTRITQAITFQNAAVRTIWAAE